MDINENLAKAAKRSLRLPLPDKQLVIVCDASEHAAGYVLLIEDYTETNDGPMKTYPPVSFGTQRFTEGQMSNNVRKGVSGDALCFRRICTHTLGCQNANNRNDR